jgi:hypothetical protein
MRRGLTALPPGASNTRSGQGVGPAKPRAHSATAAQRGGLLSTRASLYHLGAASSSSSSSAASSAASAFPSALAAAPSAPAAPGAAAPAALAAGKSARKAERPAQANGAITARLLELFSAPAERPDFADNYATLRKSKMPEGLLNPKPIANISVSAMVEAFAMIG